MDATVAAEQPKHEYLVVAKGATLAQSCAYLRDSGVQILGHERRASDGRWVIKVMAQAAQ